MALITIFTPTYNRSNNLIKLYEKLIAQSCKDFEWMIIDDGSTDNTKEIVNSFIKENILHISYFYKTNHGKQSAVNFALDKCKTDWFAFCDSDDWYLPYTVYEMKDLITNNKNNWTGIVARRCDIYFKFKKNKKIDFDKKVLSLFELYDKYKFHAETCAVFLTAELRKAKYPIIKDKFIPESFMFDRFSSNDNKVLFLDKAWSVSSYQKDGLTVQSTKLYHNNKTGVLCALIEATNANRGIKIDLKNYLEYYLWKHIYRNEFEFNETMPSFHFKLIYLLAIPIIPFLFLLKKPTWIWAK